MIRQVDNIRDAIANRYEEGNHVILLSLFETSEFYQNEKSMIADGFISVDNDGHWLYNGVPVCVGNNKLLLG